MNDNDPYPRWSMNIDKDMRDDWCTVCKADAGHAYNGQLYCAPCYGQMAAYGKVISYRSKPEKMGGTRTAASAMDRHAAAARAMAGTDDMVGVIAKHYTPEQVRKVFGRSLHEAFNAVTAPAKVDLTRKRAKRKPRPPMTRLQAIAMGRAPDHYLAHKSPHRDINGLEMSSVFAWMTSWSEGIMKGGMKGGYHPVEIGYDDQSGEEFER